MLDVEAPSPSAEGVGVGEAAYLVAANRGMTGLLNTCSIKFPILLFPPFGKECHRFIVNGDGAP